MPPDNIPESLSVPLSSLVNLAIEYWRLATWLAAIPGSNSSAAGPARHALRRFEEFFKSSDLEVRSMDGQPFDPGLAVRVIDALEDATLPDGRTVIAETLSPMVLWHGRVLKPAEIVIRRGVGKGRA